ncbi:MAG: hypothetical protein HY694_15900 [Deltaproteobacteria bacterium]|nr:hypothetical protein [Deltaproteobacteria bacterium]
MKEDIVLLVVVFAVWAVLALLYATVPMLAMPGYASVWGVGSVIFLLLAGMILVAEMRGRNDKSTSEQQAATEKEAGE